jgi:hypothetical protein
MHKRFLYAVAAILMLAIAHHLGASTATTQGVGDVTAANVALVGPDVYYTCVVGRTFYLSHGLPTVFSIAQPVPGTAAVVATGSDGIYLTAMLASGDVYQWDGSTAWIRRGNMTGAPISARLQTWGQVKARFR